MNHLSLDIRVPIERDNPSICRDEEKCIRCGMCKEVCTKDIGVHGTYTFEQTGGKAVCIHCGQCANVCPYGAIDTIHGKYTINSEKCKHCKKCIAKFYNGCIICEKVSGKKER